MRIFLSNCYKRIIIFYNIIIAFSVWNDYTLSSIATPAKTHFDGLSLVFRLNVHTNVGPLCLILYTGQSYMFRRSCLSLMMAFTCMTGNIGNKSFILESTIQPKFTSQPAPSNIKSLTMAPSLGAELKTPWTTTR